MGLVRVGDLQCPARIVLARVRPPGAVAWAATYDAPVDLEAVADLHRGELVLVVGEHGHDVDPVLVELDGDGQRVSPWR